MSIRIAEDKDLNRIKDLLLQVNNVHAEGRPDFFIKDKQKYTETEIIDQLHDKTKLIFVYTDENDLVLGYSFCQIKEYKNINNIHPHKCLYIDDLCVDEKYRRQHIGQSLLEYVEEYARNNNFYTVELNVWECNSSAKAFYERMGMKVLKIGMEKIIKR